MATAWEKVDQPLQEIWANYQQIKSVGIDEVGWVNPRLPEDGQPIFVSLSYDGTSLAVSSPGFTIEQDNEDGTACATIMLDDLEALTENAQILQIRVGAIPELDLDTSVIEIHARKATSGGGTFQWAVDRSTGIFSGSSGENIIVGVVDTGIDFKHHNFFSDNTPTTRILRIWDQGLQPAAGEKSPEKALLFGPKTYGVEYTNDMINDLLRKKAGAKKIRHKDCVGHGTHVASTAAGDGRQNSFLGVQGFDFVGVAPKAWIIMVKHLELTNAPSSSIVDAETMQKDAYTYITKVAKSLTGPLADLPVVINSSFGRALGPHDGREASVDFISKFFDPSKKGLAGIFSAGNSAGRRLNATITIPASGSIDFPVEMVDTRTVKKNSDTCKSASNTTAGLMEFWYKAIAPQKLKLSVTPPGASTPIAGNDLTALPVVQNFDGKKQVGLFQTADVALGTSTVRVNAALAIFPDKDTHKTGTFTVNITAPAGTVVHAWSKQNDKQGIVFPDPMPAAVATSVVVGDSSTINGNCSSPNVTTVAAYDDTTGAIASFSSRGPLMDFTGAGVLAKKPDIAGPGVGITAAQSSSGVFDVDTIRLLLGTFYVTFKGTSMAAPHITGVAALMMQINKNLSSLDVRNKLIANARTPSAPDVNAFGGGLVDAKKTIDAP